VLVFGKKRPRLIKILLQLQHVADRVWLLQLQSSDHNDIIIRWRNEQQIGLCGPCALASQCLGFSVAAGVSKNVPPFFSTSAAALVSPSFLGSTVASYVSALSASAAAVKMCLHHWCPKELVVLQFLHFGGLAYISSSVSELLVTLPILPLPVVYW